MTSPRLQAGQRQTGFTLVELITILLIIGILSMVFVHRLPTDMDEEAAVREMRRAIRLAQHKAMTRRYDNNYTDPNRMQPWGITVSGNRYTVQRQGEDCTVSPATKEGCAEADYLARLLLNDSTMTLVGGPVWFNGLGEPIDANTGTPITPAAPADPAASFTVAATRTVLVAPRTGYVQ